MRSAGLRRPVAIGGDQHVGRNQRSASRAEHAAHALDDRPQRDDGGHADGDADEEEQQPLQDARVSRPPCARRTSSDIRRASAIDAAIPQDQARLGTSTPAPRSWVTRTRVVPARW